MADETERVSYSEPGYQTIEGEAEARQEERERLRRRLLCCIRGQLRERAGLRWWLAVLLIGAARKTQREFGKASPLAGKLLIPYLAWLCFAAYLNGGICWLNRDRT